MKQRYGIIAVFAIFAAIGFLSATQMVAFMTLAGQPHEPVHVYTAIMLEWCLWAMVAPLLVRVCRRYPLSNRRPYRRIALLFAVSLAVVLGKLILDGLIVHLGVLPWLGPPGDPPPGGYPPLWLAVWIGLLSPKTFVNLLICWVVMAVIFAWQYSREARGRELREARLNAQLTEAQLNALRMQLQPHFLFNTLNSISSLLADNPAAADEMLASLGGLLRRTLETANRRVTALREELELVKAYLDIEKTRFQDRLEVRCEAAPDALDAGVPGLLLQPIVENAVRHGVAMTDAKGWVAIHARRVDAHLVISVANSGPSVRVDSNPRPSGGNGLGITRKRLQILYGDSHRFSFRLRENGGAEVTVAIPYASARNEGEG